MASGVKYNKVTGQIEAILKGSEINIMIEADTDHDCLIGEATQEYHYVDLTGTPTLTPRPELIPTINKMSFAADGVDQIQFTNIPMDTIISVDGTVVGLCQDGIFSLTATVAGDYDVEFKCFPYLTKTITVTANAV